MIDTHADEHWYCMLLIRERMVLMMMMMAGDWWAMDLSVVARRMEKDNFFDYFPSASTINGKLGDLFNCSGNNQLSHIL